MVMFALLVPSMNGKDCNGDRIWEILGIYETAEGAVVAGDERKNLKVYGDYRVIRLAV